MRNMFDIVYAVDDLSSIGSDSVGGDAPSDISVGGSTISSLGSHNPTTNKMSYELSISINEDFDDGEASEPSHYGALKQPTPRVSSIDIEQDANTILEFDCLFLQESFQSFSDDEDGEASIPTHCAGSQKLGSIVSAFPCKFSHVLIGVKQEEGKCLHRNCEDLVRRINSTKPEKDVQRFYSSDAALRRTFRLPSRSLSLDIKIRL